MLTPIASRLPVGPRGIAAARPAPASCSRCPTPSSPPSRVAEFLKTPVEWYFHLALRTSEHGRVSLSQHPGPGRASSPARSTSWPAPAHMATAAERLADATYVELRGSHFLQMEQPERVHELLLAFLDRVS